LKAYIVLTPFDLFLSSFLVLLAGFFSVVLRLGVEKRLLVAALRTVVQLSLLGLVLEKVFATHAPFLVIFILVLMTVVAGREAVSRTKYRYINMFLDTVFVMGVTAFVVGTVVTQVVLKVKPWYQPQYVIPIVGMILGNSLNGLSLALDAFLDYLVTRKDEIELYLSFGATRFEALQLPLRYAVRRGLIPIINAMSIVGVVSLPGIMTGQILAGIPPAHAVAYQILIMFMLAGAYALGTVLVTLCAGWKLLDQGVRLATEKIKT